MKNSCIKGTENNTLAVHISFFRNNVNALPSLICFRSRLSVSIFHVTLFVCHRSSWKPCVNVLQDQNDTTILLQNRSCIGWRNLILPRPSREHSRFQIHMCFLYPYRIRLQTTNIGLKTRSLLLLGLDGSVDLSVLSYPK